MKIKLLTLALAFGLLSGGLPASLAQDEADTPVKKTTKKSKKSKKQKKSKKSRKDKEKDEQEEVTAPKEESAVGKLLKQNTFFNNDKPNFDADYFIFLRSASWCGPCNREMPEVVKGYELMQRSGQVELILLSHDQTPEVATQWFKKFNATFPALMKGGVLPKLPAAPGIPHATIMKADGTVIEAGHGSIVKGWKSKTIGENTILGDSDEPRVARALKKMKFTNGKPSRKAKLYIYLYTPKVDDIDTELFESLADQYRDMKKNKVEVLVITSGESASDVSRTLKKNKIKFPAIMKDAEGVSELPGIGDLGTAPQAWIITQGGGYAAGGEQSVAKDWEKYVVADTDEVEEEE